MNRDDLFEFKMSFFGNAPEFEYIELYQVGESHLDTGAKIEEHRQGCHEQLCSLCTAQECLIGTSLVVQSLRLRAPSAEGAWVQSLFRKLDPTCHKEDPVCGNKEPMGHQLQPSTAK